MWTPPQHFTRWVNINQRCYNTKHQQHKDYGGRGITNYWRNDFKGFQSYLFSLGEQPKDYTLDRIHNDKNYEPGNLRWASRGTQVENRRASVTKVGKSGYKFVSQLSCGKFIGKVKHKCVTYNTACYNNPADAYLKALALKSLLHQR